MTAKSSRYRVRCHHVIGLRVPLAFHGKRGSTSGPAAPGGAAGVVSVTGPPGGAGAVRSGSGHLDGEGVDHGGDLGVVRVVAVWSQRTRSR